MRLVAVLWPSPPFSYGAIAHRKDTQHKNTSEEVYCLPYSMVGLNNHTSVGGRSPSRISCSESRGTTTTWRFPSTSISELAKASVGDTLAVVVVAGANIISSCIDSSSGVFASEKQGTA